MLEMMEMIEKMRPLLEGGKKMNLSQNRSNMSFRFEFLWIRANGPERHSHNGYLSPHTSAESPHDLTHSGRRSRWRGKSLTLEQQI